MTAAYAAKAAQPYVPWDASKCCQVINAPNTSPDTRPLPIPMTSLALPPGAVGPYSCSRMPLHRPAP
ncbi:hypothetical protein GCM10027176_22180 [Actinoallomurus bryophytorum]